MTTTRETEQQKPVYLYEVDVKRHVAPEFVEGTSERDARDYATKLFGRGQVTAVRLARDKMPAAPATEPVGECKHLNTFSYTDQRYHGCRDCGEIIPTLPTPEPVSNVWFSVRDTNNTRFEISKRPKDIQIALHCTDGRTVYAYLSYDQYAALIHSERRTALTAAEKG
jgi:hypothetical protein